MPINIALSQGHITKTHLGIKEATEFVDEIVSSLLKKGAITKSNHEAEKIISFIFLRQKSDGGFRFKKLN